jgi:hypothetical protein
MYPHWAHVVGTSFGAITYTLECFVLCTTLPILIIKYDKDKTLFAFLIKDHWILITNLKSGGMSRHQYISTGFIVLIFELMVQH